MMRLKLTTFAVGLGLSVLFGYFLWRYATECETFKLSFSPLFTTEYCTRFGYFLKGVAILAWVVALIVLSHLCYKHIVLIRRQARQLSWQHCCSTRG
jgi:hypothetical protein